MSVVEAPRATRKAPASLFALAVALLAVMAAWWFWFLAQSVNREDVLWQDNVALQMELMAQRLQSESPVVGPLPFDASFSVAPAGSFLAEPAQGLGVRIRGTDLEVRAAPGLLDDHARYVARRKSMVYGEGAFLLVLVVTCVAMLYRLVLAEQRYRRDMESFLARVTHEMKTPLAGLKALLQTLRAGRVPEDRVKDLAELGLRQAEREEHLIENLLLAQRLATTREKLVTTPLDVARLLSDFAAHRVGSMGTEGRLAVQAQPGLMAQGHAGALGTILDNLADNAFKYGASRVSLHARSDGPRVAIDVADDGMGFDPSRAEALFVPFQREAEGTAGRHGTGLGLPISRELARELGGDLRARSEGPGRGATFTIILPAGTILLPAGGAPSATEARA